jgi:hypothetical protein
MIPFFLAAILSVTPAPTAQCSMDGHFASATGKTRITKAGVECQYSHVEFKYYQSIFVDEKHIFWQTCGVQ